MCVEHRTVCKQEEPRHTLNMLNHVLNGARPVQAKVIQSTKHMWLNVDVKFKKKGVDMRILNILSVISSIEFVMEHVSTE